MSDAHLESPTTGGMIGNDAGHIALMSLTLIRIDLPSADEILAVFRDDGGDDTTVRFRLDDSGLAHAEDVFAEAYLSVPGPDVPQAHELTQVVAALGRIRSAPLPSGEALASAWAAVGDELEHDWALQDDSGPDAPVTAVRPCV